MSQEESMATLKLWGKIGISLVLIILFLFAMDKCESKSTNENSSKWEEDDFDMQGIQRP